MMQVEKIKAFPKRRYDPNEKVWEVPMVPENLSQVKRFFLEHNVVANQKIKDWFATEIDKNFKGEFKNLKKTLYPFQVEGANFILNKERVLLLDEMGLGKTVQAIAAIEEISQFPCLVVCPQSLKINWKREIEDWTNRSVSVLYSGETPQKTDYVVCNYDIIGQFWDKGNPFETLVCDESHYLKNKKAQRTANIATLARDIPVRILMTGTPVTNRPVDLISQLEIIGQMKRFGGYWDFAKRYCQAYKGKFGWNMDGAANLEELHVKLSDFALRRTKAQVLSDLPKKIRSVIPIDLDNKDKYQRTIDQMKVSRLKVPALENLEKLLKIIWSGKKKSVFDWIKNTTEEGKLIVFANHIETQKEILEAFPGSASVLGAYDSEKRQSEIDKFQKTDCPLIVCSIKAGGIGITLTAANKVAFVELPWTPADLIQAEDRAHRIGQKSAVNVYCLLGDDTIETAQMRMLERKQLVTSVVHDGIEEELIKCL